MKASSHIINFDSFNNFFNLVLNFTLHVDAFGGKIVIFCGDPRQTLPVIPKASRSVVVSALLIKCPLIWNSASYKT